LNYCLLPTIVFSNLQRGNLIVCSSFDSHHPEIGYWPPMATSSLVLQKLPMFNPILSIVNKCRDIGFKTHPTYIIYSTLPSTFSTKTMEHNRFESFNHLPLKSHTKYVHLSSFLPHFPRKVFHRPHKFLMNPFIRSYFLYLPSPHTTHKAHIDPCKIEPLSYSFPRNLLNNSMDYP
jgi:hypothetical protein